MLDIAVIGAGPAGITSSIYAKRAGMNVKVFYYGESQIEKAHKIDNYYGFENGITGKDLYENGINQAKNLGIEVEEKEVIDISYDFSNKFFKLKLADEELETKSVIIATGNKKIKPNITGVEEFDGKGISYCAICDGFFYRNKKVVVIGNGDFAVSEASDLINVVSDLTILTDGLEAPNTTYKVDTRKIKSINGDSKVQEIEFEDGEKLPVDGIFVALGVAGGLDYAKKMGVATEGEKIIVDENMQTNIKGLFCAGNITGGLLQVNKAGYEGALAGLAAVKYVKENN